MRLTLRVLESAFLLLCLSSTVSCASHVLNAKARKPEIARDLLVAVPQGEIDAGFNPSMTGLAVGGLLGAIVDVSINQSRASETQNTVKVVRNAMLEYDFDQRALSSTEQALASLGWMNIGNSSFSKELNDTKLLKSLDASLAQELIVVSFRYALNDNFSSLWITWNVSIMKTRPSPRLRPKDRLKSSKFTYGQDFSCVSSMENPAADASSNAAFWAQDQGKRSQASIESCLAEVGPLLKLSMEMTPQQRVEAIKQASNKEVRFPEVGVSGMPFRELPAGSLVMEHNSKHWVLLLKEKADQ